MDKPGKVFMLPKQPNGIFKDDRMVFVKVKGIWFPMRKGKLLVP